MKKFNEVELEPPKFYRTEGEVVRRFTRLSTLNFSVDANFYPLGSCTMKYNPKICDFISTLPGLRELHPMRIGEDSAQARTLRRILSELNEMLSDLCGFSSFSLSPAAGAHGELSGCLIIRKYHADRNDSIRNEMLIPDSAHGTNPASAAIAGFKVVTIKSGPTGCVDIDDLKRHLSNRTAGMMMTNPNTLGLFEERVLEICELVHSAGGLMYYDGANLNAIVGVSSPGAMGFDVGHIDLHKTFAVPHGGGGPGAGPIGVRKGLEDLLPGPIFSGGKMISPSRSIGKVIGFNGNVGALVRAWAFIKTLGSEGVERASRDAVIAANYVRVSLKDIYPSFVSERFCAHEVLLSAEKLKREKGINALMVAKALIQMGFHPPTIYFPMLVHEALLIEPTETENLETLDEFISAMRRIAELSLEKISKFPNNTIIRHPDEARAARNPVLKG